MTDTATVRVWSGSASAYYDDILDDDPDTYDVPVHEPWAYVPHDEHVVLADRMEHHGTYAFHVDTNEPVELIVETNDSYHAPKEGFTDGIPIERGLLFAPEGHPRYSEAPFQCEIWGRIRFRVEEVDSV
jgi:hypothetical protein